MLPASRNVFPQSWFRRNTCCCRKQLRIKTIQGKYMKWCLVIYIDSKRIWKHSINSNNFRKNSDQFNKSSFFLQYYFRVEHGVHLTVFSFLQDNLIIWLKQNDEDFIKMKINFPLPICFGDVVFDDLTILFLSFELFASLYFAILSIIYWYLSRFLCKIKYHCKNYYTDKM